jgi:hypothetical protein
VAGAQVVAEPGDHRDRALDRRRYRLHPVERHDHVRRFGDACGKARLGWISKAGQADIRRLLITGAMTRIMGRARHKVPAGSWIHRRRRSGRVSTSIRIRRPASMNSIIVITVDTSQIAARLRRRPQAAAF